MQDSSSLTGRSQAQEPRDAAFPDLERGVRDGLPRRDPEALERFFDAYFDRIYGYVRRLVGTEHLAEDLTQDIFLHLYQALPKYDPERELRPWVFTIATNKIRDYWRSRRHRDGQQEVSVERDDDATFELPAQAPRPDARLGQRELEAGLRDAVDLLPDGMRVTVLLRVYEGLSFEAIGAMLDRNEVAIRKRYSRALELLRAALTDGGPAPLEGS